MFKNDTFQQFLTVKKAALVIAAVCVSSLSAWSFAQQSNPITLRSDAPDRYFVKKGDTLWGISGKFLADPWRWPEIWGMNKDDIKNPHLIYPGDEIVLIRNADGSVRLVLNPDKAVTGALSSAAPLEKLEPKIREVTLQEESIPTIPPGDIEPFLTHSFIGNPGIAASAYIVEGRDRERILRGVGDLLYAVGINQKQGTRWDIFRAGKPVNDINGKQLGIEYRFLGTAQVERFGKDDGEASAIRVTSANEEIGIGDRLVAVPKDMVVSYVPHAPEHNIEAFIVGSKRDSVEMGRSDVVVLDQGSNQGLEIGHVLAVYRQFAPINDPRPNDNEERIVPGFDNTTWWKQNKSIKIPDERIGLLFVFRVFDKSAYALLLNMTDPARVGDFVRNP